MCITKPVDPFEPQLVFAVHFYLPLNAFFADVFVATRFSLGQVIISMLDVHYIKAVCELINSNNERLMYPTKLNGL